MKNGCVESSSNNRATINQQPNVFSIINISSLTLLGFFFYIYRPTSVFTFLLAFFFSVALLKSSTTNILPSAHINCLTGSLFAPFTSHINRKIHQSNVFSKKSKQATKPLTKQKNYKKNRFKRNQHSALTITTMHTNNCQKIKPEMVRVEAATHR